MPNRRSTVWIPQWKDITNYRRNSELNFVVASSVLCEFVVKDSKGSLQGNKVGSVDVRRVGKE